MKTFKLITAMLLLCLVFSCDKVDKLTQFDIGYNEKVVIESSAVVDLPFNVFTPEISSNSESTFENNNTRKNLIEYFELKTMTLEIEGPDHGNFDFLNSIEICISAENEPEVKISWKDQIEANSSGILKLDTSNDDLQQYLIKDQFNLRLATITDEIITSDHHINVKSVFFGDAKIFGL
ncbi:hypothetical protein [Pseudotamlana carrageenivorans]|uniref:Auto-transporter adhesin head GIN domain-containing protein n=1 Tax=Pseudotamlana carrageenivorans TaxID=2069432 RepID=A0A2I7SG83_9FLAO|nr:hypothetical protein [Tamlana carrageenivorans]AUS04864.1 hypothetical protein C1A40_04965 [Tamlana carrageenivorans]